MDYWNGETEPDSDQFEGMDYYILGNLGGEKPGRPPAELNQGPPTLSLRQDKKERTSHRTAAPAWASSSLSPVRARNLQILRYFLAQPPPFRCQTRLAAVISAEAPRPSRTELVSMGETRVRMCATPPPSLYEHLYTPRVGRFLHWKRPPEMPMRVATTLSARSIAFAPTRTGICPHCGFACSEDACYACRTPPTRATATSTYWRNERFRSRRHNCGVES